MIIPRPRPSLRLPHLIPSPAFAEVLEPLIQLARAAPPPSPLYVIMCQKFTTLLFFQLSRPDILRPDSHSRQQRTIPRLSSWIFRSARAVPAQPLILRRPFPRRAQRRYHSVDTAPAASLFFITSFIQLRAVVPGSRRPSHCEQLYSPGASAHRHFGPLYSLRDADSCRRFPALYRF